MGSFLNFVVKTCLFGGYGLVVICLCGIRSVRVCGFVCNGEFSFGIGSFVERVWEKVVLGIYFR